MRGRRKGKDKGSFPLPLSFTPTLTETHISIPQQSGDKERPTVGLTLMATLQPNGGLVAQLPVQLSLVRSDINS